MENHSSRPPNHRTPSHTRGMTPTSPGSNERPGTSGSYAEPKSHYLHQALMERRGLVTPQPQITSSAAQSTPHRSTPSRRPSTSRATPFRDEWTAAAETGVSRSQSTGPRMRGRRASESVGGDPAKAGLSVKDSNALIDRLQKDNFDLKLRMTLQDEKVKKIAKQLEETQERISKVDELAERCASAEEKAAQLEDQCDQVRAQYEETWSHNQELVAMSEELARELNERDNSINEAAQIIYDLEQRVGQMEEAQAQTPSAKSFSRRVTSHPDSDYFSGEADSPLVVAPNLRGRPSSSSSSSIMPADSDYYSATSYSSPASAASKKPRPVSRRVKTAPAEGAAPPRRRSNSDQINQSADATGSGSIQPYDGRRSSTVKPQSTLQPPASIQSSPDPPVLRAPGLRRSKKGQAAAMASLRLHQVDQRHLSGPETPRAALYMPQQMLAPGSAPPLAIQSIINQRKMHSMTPVQHIPRGASEPPQDRTAVQPRPLQTLYMSGELNRPVTSDTHNRYGSPLPLRAPGQAPAEATPTVLSPAATPAPPTTSADRDDDRESIVTASIPARPYVWRDRSNMSSIALPLMLDHRSNMSSLAHALTSSRLQQGRLPDDQMSEDSISPTSTIGRLTISSQLDLNAQRNKRLSELGSEYSDASTVRESAYAGYSRKQGNFGSDVLFRP